VREMTCNLPGCSDHLRIEGLREYCLRAMLVRRADWRALGDVCHMLSRVSYSAGEEREVTKGPVAEK
jgi:hypothetical protein